MSIFSSAISFGILVAATSNQLTSAPKKKKLLVSELGDAKPSLNHHIHGKMSATDATLTLTDAGLRFKSNKLQIHQQPTRVLQRLFHPHQECHRAFAVHDPVIVAQRQIHHRADNDLAADHHGPVLDLVHAQNA